MASLRHPNIVLFMGICLEPPCVVTEFCVHGSLFDVLAKVSSGAGAALLSSCVPFTGAPDLVSFSALSAPARVVPQRNWLQKDISRTAAVKMWTIQPSNHLCCPAA